MVLLPWGRCPAWIITVIILIVIESSSSPCKVSLSDASSLAVSLHPRTLDTRLTKCKMLTSYWLHKEVRLKQNLTFHYATWVSCCDLLGGSSESHNRMSRYSIQNTQHAGKASVSFSILLDMFLHRCCSFRITMTIVILIAVGSEYHSLLAKAQEATLLLLHLLFGVCFPCNEADVEADTDERG